VLATMRTFDASNYFQGSEALWKAIPAAWCRVINNFPERVRLGNYFYVRNHKSPHSWYYVREDGRSIIRISNHWSVCLGGSSEIRDGMWVSTCYWRITRANKFRSRFGNVCGGEVFFEDMTSSMERWNRS